MCIGSASRLRLEVTVKLFYNELRTINLIIKYKVVSRERVSAITDDSEDSVVHQVLHSLQTEARMPTSRGKLHDNHVRVQSRVKYMFSSSYHTFTQSRSPDGHLHASATLLIFLTP